MRSETIFTIFLLVISIVGLFTSLKLDIIHRGGEMGPGFLPLVLSSLLIVLILVYLFSNLARFKNKSSSKKRENKIVYYPHIIFIFMLIISLALIPLFGMLVSLGIFSFVILLMIEKLTWYKSLIFSILLIIGIYFIFDFLLGMKIPGSELL
ncbi:tripartite tricarboxylate transporter TctB family protein [Virgibacillus sp. W0181]|uniref:tripartite tricarboxylate transporter TctB family protein n=1 Tax=Virgibacillus sp. W0181 TaxID=3391581 RepID=UPI003F47D1DD